MRRSLLGFSAIVVLVGFLAMPTGGCTAAKAKMWACEAPAGEALTGNTSIALEANAGRKRSPVTIRTRGSGQNDPSAREVSRVTGIGINGNSDIVMAEALHGSNSEAVIHRRTASRAADADADYELMFGWIYTGKYNEILKTGKAKTVGAGGVAPTVDSQLSYPTFTARKISDAEYRVYWLSGSSITTTCGGGPATLGAGCMYIRVINLDAACELSVVAFGSHDPKDDNAFVGMVKGAVKDEGLEEAVGDKGL